MCWPKTAFRDGSSGLSFTLRMAELTGKATKTVSMILRWVCPPHQRHSKAPIMREEERGQPGTQNHCFSSHWISRLRRDFCSLRDTMDTVEMRNNGIRLPLSKCERRQWLVTNTLQSLPDHMTERHGPTHIPNAFHVISGDRKWCLSYNGQGSECQSSCHSIYQLSTWGLL